MKRTIEQYWNKGSMYAQKEGLTVAFNDYVPSVPLWLKDLWEELKLSEEGPQGKVSYKEHINNDWYFRKGEAFFFVSETIPEEELPQGMYSVQSWWVDLGGNLYRLD